MIKKIINWFNREIVSVFRDERTEDRRKSDELKAELGYGFNI